MESGDISQSGSSFILSDLVPPAPPVRTQLSGPPVPPQQRVYFYSPDEWEDFIREWATGLAEDYAQIKRLGGPNDRGVDIAGFKTVNGFEGPWDCFQAKHYADPLNLSDILPELLKLLVNVVAGQFTLPDRYVLLAPKGCGTTLNRLLSKPTELRSEFLKRLQRGDTLTNGLTDEVLASVRTLSQNTEFSRFQSVELIDALETHRKTAYYTARFGGPLVKRPEIGPPPADLGEIEVRYIEQLVDVYAEKYPGDEFKADELSSNSLVGRHFQRQRVSFYSAEALRLYARDSVPDGTFKALQDDIYAGVVEIADGDYSGGMARLAKVLTTAGQLDLSSHTLISVSRLDDRKGICHQLANEDRLNWMGLPNDQPT